jgi:hypothetical protein
VFMKFVSLKMEDQIFNYWTVQRQTRHLVRKLFNNLKQEAENGECVYCIAKSQGLSAGACVYGLTTVKFKRKMWQRGNVEFRLSVRQAVPFLALRFQAYNS